MYKRQPSIPLIKSLINSGANINAYDPQAIQEAKFYLNGYDVNYYLNKYDALEEVDAVILVTEWKEFRSPDFDKMLDLMKGNVFIDGRNQFNKDYISSAGFKYFQIGVK